MSLEPAPVIVEGVSKRYLIGTRKPGQLAEHLDSLVRAPFRRFSNGDVKADVSPSTDTRDFWALRDVSLQVQPGEVMGLIGENGAGKSTLLKLLARITAPTEGRIELRGRVGSLLEVGTGFHPELSGRENVFLNGAILGMRRHEIAARYDEIVAFAGLEKFIDTPVKRYSSGMHVRLAFAVASYLDTDILLLDEVLAVGDQEFQGRSENKIDTAKAAGRTVVFCSHGLSSVQRLCDRCVWMDQGRIRKIGATSEVISAYLDHATKAPVAGGEVVIGDDRQSEAAIGGLRLRRVAIVDEGGSVTDRVHLGQPFSVRLTVDVSERLESASFEVGINAVDGTPVVSSHSVDRGRPAITLDPGLHEIWADLEVTLLPGEFSIDIGAHRYPQGPSYAWMHRVLTFTALNEDLSGAERYPWTHVRGSVRADSSWRVDSPADRPDSVASAKG